MRAKIIFFLSGCALSLLLIGGSLVPARCADVPAAEVAARGGAIVHAAKFDFAEDWGETIDWEKLDLLTRELAPDRLDLNALCIKATGKALKEFPDGLPAADAETFVAALAAHVK